MPPLRIAQIMASGPVMGGLEKHFADLCGGLSVEHQVLAIADPAQASHLSASVQFCPLEFAGSRRNPFTLLRLHRVLKSFRPDVVHTHANKASQMVANLRLFQGATRVATVHGFKTNNRVFRHFDTVICVSPAIRDQVDLPQAVVIPNGIEPLSIPETDRDYLKRELGLHDNRPIAIAAGRLAAVKGYAGLIRAWQGIDAHLVIAGEGPERFALETLIQRINLRGSVHLIGFRRDVPRLMSQSDLVVISSEREGFPYAMVEALHLEKVIVSTHFPGAHGFLPNNFLVNYGDEAGLHRLIHRTLSSLENSRQAYLPTWQWAKSELTVQYMTAATAQVYSKLIPQAA
ncbi:glycosyltransferase [Bythopirellula polymerisocia]|uniref:Alpha-D-kanosaminyltransferase n=1 Tax=Bythopirellula polymerisocia TaxID=2528003 RepID=A0A5C6CUS5_9BACT|nr:glycosyltransferase [Bythopirellula polymerisocia]TWU28178.1 Alpha-D-kanosaminyltransferase [Bythopirellula polymerisocia]